MLVHRRSYREASKASTISATVRSVHRIAFYGDGRGTITIDSKEYSEDFTYSVSDGVISVSFEGQDDIQIQYLYDSEEEKLTLYTKDGKESCALSPVKE